MGNWKVRLSGISSRFVFFVTGNILRSKIYGVWVTQIAPSPPPVFAFIRTLLFLLTLSIPGHVDSW